MNTIPLTNPERIQALEGFGYSEREAEFLCLAGLHSGYFLHRQYCEFVGKQIGGTARTLIEKLLNNEHVSVSMGCDNLKIYHLCARPFYKRLGQEDNRNRRERSTAAIRNKLMQLDFVLEFSEFEFLATEREKVEYFTVKRGMDRSVLPSKRFISYRTGELTERYFVDKYPMYLTQKDDSNEEPEVVFCFIDEGMESLSRFETHLHQYQPLFQSINRFEVKYIAASDQFFEKAQRLFVRFLQYGNRRKSAPLSKRINPKLLEHFEDRRLYDAQQLQSFDRDRLIQFRNDRDRFSGPVYQALYDEWTRSLEAVPTSIPEPQTNPTSSLPGTFSTHLLRHNYDVFGMGFGSSPRASIQLGRAANGENRA